MSDRAAALSAWLASVTYEDVRRAESAYPLRLPSGKLLRGVSLGQGFYLTRDREILEAWGGELHEIPMDSLVRRLDLAAAARIVARARAKTAQRRRIAASSLGQA